MKERNEGSGFLFKEKDKKSPNHPDYTGKLVVDGDEVRIAGWIKESAAGNKYMSLQLDTHERRTRQEVSTVDPDDDIPF